MVLASLESLAVRLHNSKSTKISCVYMYAALHHKLNSANNFEISTSDQITKFNAHTVGWVFNCKYLLPQSSKRGPTMDYLLIPQFRFPAEV